MMSWDYFKFRWDRMQSVDIGANQVDIVHLQNQVMHLEQILVYIIGKTALGQSIKLDDAAIKDFLHIADIEDPKRAVAELIGRCHGKYEPKLVTCPRCGSKVRDLPGVYDEKCMWCGQQLKTKY